MTNGYSNDLRQRAVSYYDDNHTQAETCAVFQISRAALTEWLRLRRESGDIQLRPRPAERVGKIRRTELVAYLEAHPDAYLAEIGAALGVTGSAIHYACQRWGIVRKKADHLLRK